MPKVSSSLDQRGALIVRAIIAAGKSVIARDVERHEGTSPNGFLVRCSIYGYTVAVVYEVNGKSSVIKRRSYWVSGKNAVVRGAIGRPRGKVTNESCQRNRARP